MIPEKIENLKAGSLVNLESFDGTREICIVYKIHKVPGETLQDVLLLFCLRDQDTISMRRYSIGSDEVIYV